MERLIKQIFQRKDNKKVEQQVPTPNTVSVNIGAGKPIESKIDSPHRQGGRAVRGPFGVH